MSAIVNHVERPLEIFLSQEPAALPAKGALVRISSAPIAGYGPDSTVSHIVFSHFTDSIVYSSFASPFLGRTFHVRTLFGLNVRRHFEELLKNGQGFVGEAQIVEKTGQVRLSQPGYIGTDTKIGRAHV